MIHQKQLKTIRTAILGKSVVSVSEDLEVDKMRVRRYERHETAADYDYLTKFARVYGLNSFEASEKLYNLEKALADVQRTRLKN